MAQVICNDGTTDVDNGFVAPCINHGGVKNPLAIDTTIAIGEDVGEPSPNPSSSNTQKFTTTQKWLAVIGITAVCYYILHKAGTFKK
jgi:hypothetical protein